MESRMRGVWSGLAVAAVMSGAALGGVGCAREGARSQQAESEATVLVSAGDVAAVTGMRLESGITFTGELRPIETVAVAARFEGDLERVLVREGQAVQKGQPLAVFRPRDVQDQLRATEAQVLAAQASLVAAENAERRARRLFEAGAAAPRDLEVAEAQRTAAQAGLDAALAMRNEAQENVEKVEVPSPITGWVSQVFADGGERTFAGDPLMELVDTSTLELSATVPSEVLGRVTKGMPIRFHVDAFPGEVFQGEVDRVNPTTEPGTRQVRLYMRMPNPEGRLVGGLFASGRVIEAVRENATAAPVKVLRQEGQSQVVYALRHGRAARIPVRTGLIDEEAGVLELLGEVAPGDSLLTGVLPGLKDGVRVRIVQAGGSTAPPLNKVG
jgi:membrane fusion protein (multidrug efflux system)